MRYFGYAVLVVAFAVMATLFVKAVVRADSVTVSATQDVYDSPGGWPGYSDTDTEPDLVVYTGIVNGPIYAGWRFPIEIPQGATIEEAYVTFTQSGWWQDDVETVLAMEADGACSGFSATASPAGRTTLPGVQWNWTRAVPGDLHDSPQLAGQVQQLADAGQITHLCLIESGISGGVHAWQSIEQGNPARLTVSWTSGGGTGGTLPSPTVQPSATASSEPPTPTPTPAPTVTPTSTASMTPTVIPTTSVHFRFVSNSLIGTNDMPGVVVSTHGNASFERDHIGNSALREHLQTAGPMLSSPCPAAVCVAVYQGLAEVGTSNTGSETVQDFADALVQLRALEAPGTQCLVFVNWVGDPALKFEAHKRVYGLTDVALANGCKYVDGASVLEQGVGALTDAIHPDVALTEAVGTMIGRMY